MKSLGYANLDVTYRLRPVYLRCGRWEETRAAHVASEPLAATETKKKFLSKYKKKEYGVPPAKIVALESRQIETFGSQTYCLLGLWLVTPVVRKMFAHPF